ncbi:sterol desaturase family protein [Ovoidimarina sediminis]|uniref:sterol desaturase family protein n=1 Tax=Ovoidimarina sediminis TaxID=3079856 RepID=UPI002905FBF9|nr:sterol desaturase family protein [Rhodophyticola sp. MJ-SS7]MDU8944773.1 sterol desaturase family protein [Rhodophyticola sp. MJ-SS7]
MSEAELEGWNHLPEVPIRVSPFFTWPLNPVEMTRWVWNSWFLISEKLIIVGIAFASYTWFQPPLEETTTFAPGWIAEMYARNLILALGVGGALHLWFYTFSVQGKKLKYDPRPLMVKGRQFTLGGQIRDNMFWTLGTGVLIWTGYEVILFWALASGHMPMITWAANPVWFVAMFLLVPVWESFYFYVIHRLIHVPFLYRHVHYLHHRNINVGPWSGMSQHPIEQMIFLGSVFVHVIVGAHPVHILFHLQYFFLTAMTTHTGYQGLLIRDKNRLNLGTFHHQMHHRYFECNYGSLEIPWDKWMGTFHDGTPEANVRMQKRRKRIMGQ